MPEKKEIHEIVAHAIKAQANKRKPKDVVEDYMKLAIAGALADHLTAKGQIRDTLLPAMKRTLVSEFSKIPDIPMSLEDLENLFSDTVKEILTSCDASRLNRSGLIITAKEIIKRNPGGGDLPGGGLILP